MIIKLTVLLLLISSSLKASPEIQSPEMIIKDAYEKSQVTFIATANHSNGKTYHYLSKFLKTLGPEDTLRYIVFERYQDNAIFYEALSQMPLEAALKEARFPSTEEKIRSLCFNEWAYTIDQFFPVLRAVNAKRSRPILVTAIDGISVKNSDNYPDGVAQYTAGTCTLKDPWVIYATSANREDDTAVRFQKLYKSLKPNEKMIVVYQHSHLLPSFRSCLPKLVTFDGHLSQWTSNTGPLNWLQRFHQEDPEFQDKMKLILLDEEDSEFNPDGAFKITDYLKVSRPKESVGMALSPTLPEHQEQGLDIFRSGSFMTLYHEGTHQSSKKISELADYLIYSHDALENFKFKSAATYLPAHCQDAVVESTR